MMKPLSIFILISIVVFLGGIFFIKNRLYRTQISTKASEPSTSQMLYNRVQYLDYSEQNLKSSHKFGKTVLFFAATTWCSNCIALDKEIKQRMNEIPQNVTILRVDYDTDKTMKAKYAVTIQTTLVLLDANGKEIKRWIGTNFNDVLEQVS